MKSFHELRKEIGEYMTPAMMKKFGIENPLAGKKYPYQQEDHDCEKVHPDMSHEKWLKKTKNESVELDESQRWADKVSIPASKQTKGYIESGRAKILMNVPSSLDKAARFVVAKNPNTGSNQDKVLMFTISDPDRGRIKMFAFHGSHVSHQKAMQFAKNHKLVAMKDAKGNPLYAKESVELDEALTLASDDLNAVKKTAQKLARQSPDRTYYVVQNTKIHGDGKMKRYEVVDSVDMHLYRQEKRIIGYGKSVKESVELDEVMSDREMDRFNKAHTALHTRYHKQALQIIKFIDSVEKHKQKWVDSFGDYVTAKLPKQLKLSNPNTVEYQQGRGRGDWSFLIGHGKVRYNNRDMPWMPKSGELPFEKFMKLLDTWKKNANKPKSTGGHMGRQTESVELDESKMSELHMHIKDGKTAEQIAKIMKIDLKTVKVLMKDMKESYESVDNTAAIAKQVKQAVKKYTTGKLAVQSKGGKTRFIMVRADKIDNELRKKVLNVVAPKANVRDKSNISYGNISDRIISASVEQWMKALGLKESKRFSSFREEIANASGSGAVAGLGENPPVSRAAQKKKQRSGGASGGIPAPKKGDLIAPALGESTDTFAGCRVFEVDDAEYGNVTYGRKKWERWNKKFDMNKENNQMIKAYAGKNPNKPVIIKNSKTGEMSYLINKNY